MLHTHKRPEMLMLTAEHSDDIPLLIAHMRRIGIPHILDRHIPTHAYWGNLTSGWTAVVWLTYILSCSDHKDRAIQRWVSSRSRTLHWCIGSEITPIDVDIDRLHDLLVGLSCDHQWQAIEHDLNHHMLDTWAWAIEQIHVRIYEGRMWHISPNGLFLVNQAHLWRAGVSRQPIALAMLDPMNIPLVLYSFSHERTHPASFYNLVEQISQNLPPQRYRFIGEALTAVEFRGAIHQYNHEYLCLLPDPPSILDAPLDDARSAHRTPFSPADDQDPPASPFSDGIEWFTPMRVDLDGSTVVWNERRIAIRAPNHARISEEALRARLTRAHAALLALGERKRGRRRPRTIEALREAANAILDSYQVRGLLRLDFDEQIEERVVRRYRGRPTSVRVERNVRINVSVDTDALSRAVQSLGWQIFGSNITPPEPTRDQMLSLTFPPASGFERLHGRPISLAPHDVCSPELETGLIRLLSLGLRALASLEAIARCRLIEEGVFTLSSNRDNGRSVSRITSERLLNAFRDMTFAPGFHHDPSSMTPLSPLQQRVLHLLALPFEIYQFQG
ncbi:MAG: hypothetical protein J7455_00365 [Roseiflexus sp.]|nr:hypothetical protein [Roseiflexus sp.]MBO9364509.1 hypothetical protein [Roseiflexus sp.]